MPQVAPLVIVKWIVFAASVAYSIKQQRKIKKALRNLGSTQSEAQGRLQTKRDSAAYKQIIYGETRVGGTIILNHNTGSKNEIKHLIIELAGHEVESFSQLKFDDDIVQLDQYGNALGTYSGIVEAHYYYGSESQAALYPVIVNCGSVWDSNHRLRGSAGVYVQIKHHESYFPNGVPNITAVCRGKKVFDPRTAVVSYSNNPALCLADYYCDRKYGLGMDFYTQIDQAELIASANICDETVTLSDGVTTEKRYTANGAFTADTIHADVIEQLKAAMGGFVIDPPGRVGIVAGYWRAATLPTFDESTLVAGLSVTTKTSMTENCNRVKGMFISPENSWQATDYPPVKNATYLAQDAGREVWREINYTFVTSSRQSQYLGKIALEEARQGITVRGAGNFAWYQVAPGDVIKFSNVRRGWVDKEFIVESIGIQTGDGGAIKFPFSLRETAQEVYDWNDGEETTVDLAPNTNLPRPFDVKPPTNLVVLSDNTTREYDAITEQYIQRMLVTWDQPLDIFVINGGTIRLQYMKMSDETWTDWVPLMGSQTHDYVFPLITGETYFVRIRSENRMGIPSQWVYSDPTAATGDVVPPGEPTSFVATNGVGSIHLTWTNPTDADLDYIEIYEASATTPAPTALTASTYNQGGESSTINFVPVGQVRYYWIRAVDASGNKSDWVGPRGAASVAPLAATAGPASQSLYGIIPSGLSVTLVGAVHAYPTGGVAPYSYQWIGAGIYGVGATSQTYTETRSFNTPTFVTTSLTCRITDSTGAVVNAPTCVMSFTAAPM